MEINKINKKRTKLSKNSNKVQKENKATINNKNEHFSLDNSFNNIPLFSNNSFSRNESLDNSIRLNRETEYVFSNPNNNCNYTPLNFGSLQNKENTLYYTYNNSDDAKYMTQGGNSVNIIMQMDLRESTLLLIKQYDMFLQLLLQNILLAPEKYTCYYIMYHFYMMRNRVLQMLKLREFSISFNFSRVRIVFTILDI